MNRNNSRSVEFCAVRGATAKVASMLIGLCALLPLSLWAEAPVEEASASSSSNGYNTGSSAGYVSTEAADPEVPLSQDNSSSAGARSPSTFNPNNPASLLSKINEMQREIQRLRGQAEVQSYELKKLKEQQQAYYNDLDQRISMLSSGKKNPVLSLDTPAATDMSETTNKTQATLGTSKTKVPASGKSTNTTNATNTTSGSTTEESSYNAAYELIQNKQFAEASTAMKTFIQQYPKGKYASNAHYWLGELLLAQHQDKEAIKEFNTVIQDYPESNKVSASMLKLGFIYAHSGDTAKARTEFLEIKKMFPGTTTAQLAEERLRSLSE